MSDFTSGFWNIWVIGLTILSILGCAALLVFTGKIKVAAKQAPAAGGKTEVGVTGHVWDGDLQEYNNPLPKWWSNLFWITIVFGIVYLVLYPGLGTFPGLLKWSSSGAFSDEIAASDARLKPLYEKYAKTDIAQIAADPQARGMGERIFLVNCAPCHGSDARGSTGFPNLADGDWLYGGDPATIATSITNGRMGIMPALGPVLGPDGVKNVVAYVRSLSGLPHDGLKAQLGKVLFTQNCAACHGPEAKGNQALGAPNLTDQIWLYGSSEAAISEGVNNGRHLGISPEHTPMPAFKDSLGQGTLGPAKINLVAAYVWGLTNKPAAAK